MISCSPSACCARRSCFSGHAQHAKRLRIEALNAARIVIDTGRLKHFLSSKLIQIEKPALSEGISARSSLRCHAQKTEGVQPLNIQNVTSALLTAQKIFNKYDVGKKGSLTLKEATELLNR